MFRCLYSYQLDGFQVSPPSRGLPLHAVDSILWMWVLWESGTFLSPTQDLGCWMTLLPKLSRASGVWTHCLRRTRSAGQEGIEGPYICGRKGKGLLDPRTPFCLLARWSFLDLTVGTEGRLRSSLLGLVISSAPWSETVSSPHVPPRNSLDSIRELPVLWNDLEPLVFLLLPSKCWQPYVQPVNLILF